MQSSASCVAVGRYGSDDETPGLGLLALSRRLSPPPRPAGSVTASCRHGRGRDSRRACNSRNSSRRQIPRRECACHAGERLLPELSQCTCLKLLPSPLKAYESKALQRSLKMAHARDAPLATVHFASNLASTHERIRPSEVAPRRFAPAQLAGASRPAKPSPSR